MLEFNELRTLIKDFDDSSLQKLVLKYGSLRLNLSKAQSPEGTSVKSLTESPKIQNETKPTFVTELETELDSLPKVTETKQPFETQEATTTPLKKKENTEEIQAPMVGTFYSKSSPTSEAYVKVGTPVTKGQTVCILEAMKLFNEIESDFDGEIVEILVEDGQLIEYGQPLFLVKVK